MRVLMISGDPRILKEGTEAHKRFKLQQEAVSYLESHVWGRGGESLFPILRAAWRNRFDVVTSQDAFVRGLIAWLISAFTGARLNLQVHADLSGQSWWKRSLARILLPQADSVRVVSERLKKYLLEKGVRSPIRVLPVFIDVRTYSALRRIPHAGKNILWIGRFEAEKNPLIAIDILRKVLSEIPDANLTMVGEGSMQHALRTDAKNLPVVFPGWQQDLAKYLETADVVLCTSEYESWGASIVEALSARVPVVAPDVGIAKEAGALVVSRAHLAEKVVEVLKEGTLAKLQLPLLSEAEWVAAWKESL